MVNPNLFAAGLDDFNSSFDRSYNRAQAMHDQRARKKSGGLLASGDQSGAAAALAEGGLIDDSRQITKDMQGQEQQQYQRGRDAEADKIALAARQLSSLKQISDGLLEAIPEDPSDPGKSAAERFAAFQKMTPVLQQLQIGGDLITQITPDMMTNQGLMAFGAQAAERIKLITREDGIYKVDTQTGRAEKTTSFDAPVKPEWKERKNKDGSTTWIDLNSGQESASPPAGAPNTDDLFGALIMQESGGRAGVVGPETPYGRAQGKTQMLPATAQSMAQKLGVPWRPDLMTGATPEAAAYQEKLGRAYFDEGLQKYGGDPEKALMYYHGGPDERLWGPKTQTYAKQVLARLQPYETASIGGTPAPSLPGESQPPRFREVPGSAPEAPSAKDAPSGYRWTADGQLEFIPNGPADPKTRVNAKPPTDAQVNNASLAYAAVNGNERLNALAERGIYKPESPTETLIQMDKNGIARVFARTAKDRQFVQAAREFLAPILRKDTGAAVTDNELAYYMETYIPKYEDDPTLLWQKAQARDTALRRVYTTGRSVYDEQYGKPKWRVLTDPRGKPAKKTGGQMPAGKGGKPPLDQIFGGR